MKKRVKNNRDLLKKEIKKYDYLFANNKLYNSNKKHLRYDIAERMIKEAGQVKIVADIGSGRGIFFDRLKKKGFKVFGLEPSGFIVNSLKSPFIIRGTCDAIPFADNLFDLVFCLDVLEHIPEGLIKESLSELRRISKKYLIISAAYHDDIVEGRKVHISLKPYEEWEKLISKYFKIVSSEMIHSKTYADRTAKIYLCQKTR